MASTFTDLGLELMATGENAGTWGTKTNANLSLVEQLTGGYLSLAVAGSGTTALSIAEGALTGTAQHRVIELTGALTGSRILTFPLLTENFYFIKNSTTNAETLQLKAVSGSGATVTWATTDKGWKIIYVDGVATNTGVYEIPMTSVDDVTLTGTQTLTNKTINASQLVDGSIATAKLADDLVTLAKMAPGTDGNIISYDASGNPVAVATGNAGQVLTSAGAGAPPTFTTVEAGRTGAVSWDTTVKTSGFTASSGVGYFCNTTSTAFTVTLPSSPSAGDIVAIKDYANTWDTNNLTLGRNSQPIGGLAADSILSTEGLAVTVVYIDGTKGWLVTNSGLQEEAPGPEYVAASGGNATLTVCSHKVHVFTGPGTLCVSGAGNVAGSNSVEYLVVAGAAGGTTDWAGGSGAGGWRSYSALPNAHPLNGPAGLPVSVQGYPITVGAAGAVGTGPASCSPNGLGSAGSSSIFSTITSAGGGRSGNEGNTGQGAPGGSGGGAGTGGGPGDGSGGTGNTPPVSPAQGSNGGNNTSNTTGYTAGGGGAGGAGEGCGSGSVPGGAGGIGAFVVDGFIGPTAPSYGGPGPVSSTRYFAGGGGGAAGSPPRVGGAGGAGGGGAGAVSSTKGTAGTVNTGGGGGGGSGNESPNPGSAGGSGVVMIRYKFQA